VVVVFSSVLGPKRHAIVPRPSTSSVSESIQTDRLNKSLDIEDDRSDQLDYDDADDKPETPDNNTDDRDSVDSDSSATSPDYYGHRNQDGDRASPQVPRCLRQRLRRTPPALRACATRDADVDRKFRSTSGGHRRRRTAFTSDQAPGA